MHLFRFEKTVSFSNRNEKMNAWNGEMERTADYILTCRCCCFNFVVNNSRHWNGIHTQIRVSTIAKHKHTVIKMNVCVSLVRAFVSVFGCACVWLIQSNDSRRCEKQRVGNDVDPPSQGLSFAFVCMYGFLQYVLVVVPQVRLYSNRWRCYWILFEIT